MNRYLVELTQEEMNMITGSMLVNIKNCYGDTKVPKTYIYKLEDLFKRLAKHEPIGKTNIVAT